jgi:hypothetical protein
MRFYTQEGLLPPHIYPQRKVEVIYLAVTPTPCRGPETAISTGLNVSAGAKLDHGSDQIAWRLAGVKLCQW